MFVFGIAVSILIGVSLGFFGGGGSILTVPLLVYVFGLDPKEAIASSLLIVGLASVSGAAQHWRAGNVRPREGILFGVAGMIGAYFGGRASAFLDGGFLLLLFATMMLLTAAAMWRGRKEGPKEAGQEHSSALHRSVLKLALQGLAVGAFTGLVGAGGGFLIVPALALWAGLPMKAAVGTSLLIIVLNTMSGFAGYLSHVQLDYRLIAAVSSAAIAGSFLGSKLARRVDPAALRTSFAGFVMLMGCLILLREGPLVVSTVSPALPDSVAQVVFALAMLTVGILTGRASKRAAQLHHTLGFTQGGGI